MISPAAKTMLDDDCKTCSVCQASFRRLEHLKRHMRTHRGEKPFTCLVCGQSFNRKDSMKRHEAMHKSTSDDEYRSSFYSVRACRGCVRARVKCTRQNPCQRCASRGIACTYLAPSTPYVGANRSPGSTVALAVEDTDEVSRASPDAPQHVTASQANAHLVLPMPSQDNSAFAQSSGSANEPSNAILRATMTAESANDYQLDRQLQSNAFLSNPLDVSNTAVNWLPFIDVPWDPSLDLTYMLQSIQPGSLVAGLGDAQSPFATMSMSASSLDFAHENQPPTPDAPRYLPLGDNCTPSPVMRHDNARRHGSLYVDGQGSRLTNETIHPASLPGSDEVGMTSSPGMILKLSDIPDLASCIEPEDRSFSLAQQTYAQIFERFQTLCVHPVFPMLAYKSEWFPPAESLEIYTELFFTHFNNYYPIIHRPTFRQGHHSWVLVLATSAIGCALAEASRGTTQNTYALAEFLRRALGVEEMISMNGRTPLDELFRSQAKFIRYILESFHPISRFKDNAENSSVTLRAANSHYFWLSLRKLENSQSQKGRNQSWMDWAIEEGTRRLAYGSWLVDMHLKSTGHLALESLLSLNDVPALLPDSNELWFAESEEQWRTLSQRIPAPKRLQSMLLDLYKGNCDLSGTDDFTCTILIYAVCQRVYDVGQDVKNVLQNIDPADRTMHDDSTAAAIWLPSHPTYEKWRNGALDCLDSLHWHAHGFSARQCGLEPPVHLHLHVARVVLLSPLTEIRTLLDLLTTDRASNLENKACEEPLAAIWRWLRQDYYKARLAVIHAGVIFWHIRRYSVRSALEPNALFVATLVLWAYSLYADLVYDPAAGRDGNTDLDGNDEPLNVPAHFQVDRPCDDELVQAFIRKGNRMQPCMGGIGPIALPKAAPRILEQGKKLMSSRCSVWTLARRHREALARLVEVTATILVPQRSDTS